MTRRGLSDDGPGGIDGERLTTDGVFELLREPERRQVVDYLRDADGAVDVETLARYVAAGGGDAAAGRGAAATGGGAAATGGGDGTDSRGDGTGGSGADEPVHRATLVGLDHVHLPRLAEAGVVEYDREAGTVTYRGHERLERLLSAVRERIEA